MFKQNLWLLVVDSKHIYIIKSSLKIVLRFPILTSDLKINKTCSGVTPVTCYTSESSIIIVGFTLTSIGHILAHPDIITL